MQSNTRRALIVVAVAALIAIPTAIGTLSGSGNVNDIVQLSTTTGTLATLTAPQNGVTNSASPITSGTSAFTVTNSGSNVDTVIRYTWDTTAPYYGGVPAQTSITLRGNAYSISDLLWFKQGTVTAAGTETTSEYYSPLVIKNGVVRSTFTSAGNACTSWTGTADASFAAPTAAGTITFKYYPAGAPVDDTPATSDVFNYCVDTTNSLLYLSTGTVYESATLVQMYSTNSAGGVLKNYRYEFISAAQTAEGNSYCLVAFTGAGSSATPDLQQCEFLPYETLESTSAKIYALYDPPAFFPSTNQGGAITYAVAGTQWNPYASGTTQTA